MADGTVNRLDFLLTKSVNAISVHVYAALRNVLEDIDALTHRYNTHILWFRSEILNL